MIAIIISTIVILLGLIGIKMKTIWKRLAFLTLPSVGMIILSFIEGNAYGVLGSSYQLLFRLISLIFFSLLLLSFAKKNEAGKIEELSGIGKKTPYIFAMMVIFAVMIIGIPGTGTFIGVFYSEIGILVGGFGYIAYLGFFANILGIAISALLIFPVLRLLYFPGTKIETKEDVAKPGKALLTCSAIVMIFLVLVSIYPIPVMEPVSKWFETILG